MSGSVRGPQPLNSQAKYRWAQTSRTSARQADDDPCTHHGLVSFEREAQSN